MKLKMNKFSKWELKKQLKEIKYGKMVVIDMYIFKEWNKPSIFYKLFFLVNYFQI